MAEKIVLTRYGQQMLMDELKQLETVERLNVQKDLQAARELGDLSENAEYEAAMDYRNRVEARIQYIRQLLEQAEIG